MRYRILAPSARKHHLSLDPHHGHGFHHAVPHDCPLDYLRDLHLSYHLYYLPVRESRPLGSLHEILHEAHHAIRLDLRKP